MAQQSSETRLAAAQRPQAAQAAWLAERGELLALGGVLLLYLLLRLPALLAVPLFNDEAVYLLRAHLFPQLLYQTTTDGKLIQELVLAALALLPGDPLVYGRLLSVLAGGGTLVALWLCGRAVGLAGAGLLAGLLYTLSPVALLHDTLALPDTMLTAVSSVVLLATIRYVQLEAPTRWDALKLGLLIGLAALVKMPGIFLVVLPIAAVFAHHPPRHWWRQLVQLRMVAIGALLCLALMAPFGYGAAERNKIGDAVSLLERLAVLGGNIANVGSWLWSYLPAGLLLLPALALLRERGRHQALLAFLLLAGALLHLAFVVVGDTLYPRYLMPAWPPLLLAVAVGAVLLWRQAHGSHPGRWLVGGLVGAAMLWGGFFGLNLARDPRTAPLVAADRRQYLEAWTAGYHIPSLMQRIREIAAQNGQILLANHTQPRLVTLAARIYLDRDPTIRMEPLDLTYVESPAALHALRANGPTYLLLDAQMRSVFSFDQRFPNVRLVETFTNPNQTMAFYLYTVSP